MHECGFFSLSRTQDTLLFISECLAQELSPLTSVLKRTHIVVNTHLLSTTSYQNVNKSLYLSGSISSPDFIWKRVEMSNNSFFGVQKRINRVIPRKENGYTVSSIKCNRIVYGPVFLTMRT